MSDRIAIEKYFGGYLEMREQDGYLCLYRFNSVQREFYQKRGDFFGTQSRCQAGVYARIKNCERIAFDFEVFEKGMENVCFEIIKKDGSGESVICENRFEKDFQKEDLWMYFPYYAHIGIKNIEIVGDEEDKPSKKIYCFGDSITQGYFSNNQAIAYPQVLGREMNAEAFNCGIGGFYYDSEVLGNLNETEKPYVVTFAYGTNDWHFEYDYEEKMKETFEKVHQMYQDVPIFVILPAARVTEKETKKAGTLDDVRNNIRTEANRYQNFTVIDRTCGLDCDRMLVEDGVHPNDKGTEFLAECVLEKIQEVLL